MSRRSLESMIRALYDGMKELTPEFERCTEENRAINGAGFQLFCSGPGVFAPRYFGYEAV
jgi:hypothetical protein